MTVETGYQEFATPSALSEDVACFWASNPVSLSDRQLPHQQRVLPDGCVDIIFDLTAGAGKVVGTMTNAIVVPDDGHSLLAVRFQPGGASNYFPLPIHEITDQSISLREFWPTGSELAERLAAARWRNTQDTLQVFANELTLRRQGICRAAKAETSHFLTCSVVRALSTTSDHVSIGEVARQLAVSRQHLTRQFKQSVGISPKQFQRVVRMQRLVNSVWQPEGAQASKTKINWTEIALECGYFDQAHMISDFKDLCGTTPAAYFGS